MFQIATIIAALTSITNSYSTVDYGKINESKAKYSNSFLNSRICYSFDGSERFSLSNDLETYYLYDNLTNNKYISSCGYVF